MSCRGRCEPLLVSVVGNDPAGEAILSHWRSLGLSSRGIVQMDDIVTPAVVYCFNQGTPPSLST
jgi:sugar/nucleoside kinase (ribokinase family)